MATPRRAPRGLREIRTLSRRSDRQDEAYKIYMRLSALEREKVRLVNERDSTVRRLKEIEARLLHVDSEERALARLVDEPAPGQEPTGDAEAADEAQDAPADTGRTFRLRY